MGQKGKHTSVIKEEGYEVIHANRDGKRGAGVSIIYKQNCKIKKGEGSTEKYSSFKYVYCILQTTVIKILPVCVYSLQEMIVSERIIFTCLIECANPFPG